MSGRESWWDVFAYISTELKLFTELKLEYHLTVKSQPSARRVVSIRLEDEFMQRS